MPLVLGMFQRRADMDRAMRVENQERLRTLKANHGDAVTIFNSHDPVDYENCRCGHHQEVPAHASRMRLGWAVTTDHLVPRTQAA